MRDIIWQQGNYSAVLHLSERKQNEEELHNEETER